MALSSGMSGRRSSSLKRAGSLRTLRVSGKSLAVISEKVEEAALQVLERGKFHRNHLGRAMRDAARKGKFPAYRASWYRHSVATWAIEKGADLPSCRPSSATGTPPTVKRLYATHAAVPKVPTME